VETSAHCSQQRGSCVVLVTVTACASWIQCASNERTDGHGDKHALWWQRVDKWSEGVRASPSCRYVGHNQARVGVGGWCRALNQNTAHRMQVKKERPQTVGKMPLA
jgi:hypothetical protein